MKDKMLKTIIRTIFWTAIMAATVGYIIGGIWILWAVL